MAIDYKTVEFTLTRSGWAGYGVVEIQIEDNYDISTNKSTLNITRVRYKSSTFDGREASVLDGRIVINDTNVAIFSSALFSSSTSYVNVTPTSTSPITVSHTTTGALSINLGLRQYNTAYGLGFSCYISQLPDYTVGSTETKVVELKNQPRGIVYIANGSTFEPYQCYIGNGNSWDLAIPYIGNGSSWVQY